MRTCIICEKPISPQGKHGKCLTCFNIARRKPRASCTGCGKTLSRDNRLGRCRTCSVHFYHTEARKDPEKKARMDAASLSTVRLCWTPEAREKWRRSRPRVAAMITERALGWCPPEYRDEYRRHMCAGNKNAAIAKRIMLAKIEADRFAALETFDNLRSAADHLRRYTTVFKRGDGYLYGTAELTPQQLIKRALDKGWQPPFARAA